MRGREQFWRTRLSGELELLTWATTMGRTRLLFQRIRVESTALILAVRPAAKQLCQELLDGGQILLDVAEQIEKHPQRAIEQNV